MLKPRLTLCGISWKVMWRRFSRFLKHLECILKLQIGQYFSEGSLEREMVLVWLAEMLIELITQSSSKFNNFYDIVIHSSFSFVNIIGNSMIKEN